MAFAASSHASSSSQSFAAPKELLSVLSILSEKEKTEHKQEQMQQKNGLETQQHCPNPHLHYRYQHYGQQQHKQEQRAGSEWEGVQKPSHQRMELSQIELIYRAEGNANLVLALPQFKKVLRLPKMFKQQEQQQQQLKQKARDRETQQHKQHKQPQVQLERRAEANRQEPNENLTAGQQENNDANRLDKEFGGHLGLLLPDATQLPAEFDVLCSNIQCKVPPGTPNTATGTTRCNSSNISGNSADNSCNMSNNIFSSDTFAIEIKPKQGWLLPNDVNKLFDIKPKIKEITETTQPASLRETKTPLRAAVAATTPAETDEKALKTSADIESCVASQNEPSQTVMPAPAPAPPTTTSHTKVTATSRSTTQSGEEISHSLYDTVDSSCRYCCMQFLKMKQNKIAKRTQYCPIDLFSGSYEKMASALQALFTSPQNNLRIFRNGSLVFDDLISRTSRIEDLFASDKLQLIKHLVVTCLLREYGHETEARGKGEEHVKKESKQQPLSSSASTACVARRESGGGGGCGDENEIRAGVADGQPQLSVTSCKKQKLCTMQETRETTETTTTTETEATKVKSTLTSTEPIFPTDNILVSTACYSGHSLVQPSNSEVTCLPKRCVLQEILRLQLLAKANFQFMLDHGYADKKLKSYNIVGKLLERFSKGHTEPTLCELSPEEQYILAATALDCSIMVTFREIEIALEDEERHTEGRLMNNPFMVTVFGKTYLTKVTLLDLDPKPDGHFNKYCLQTQQIADTLRELDSERLFKTHVV